jgi:hypothetical protein
MRLWAYANSSILQPALLAVVEKVGEQALWQAQYIEPLRLITRVALECSPFVVAEWESVLVYSL